MNTKMTDEEIEQLKSDIKDLRWRWAVWTLYKVDKFVADMEKNDGLR